MAGWEGVRQKEFGKRVTRKVTEASEKVTKKWPKELRPEPPFTGVSEPSGPEIEKNVSKRVFSGVWRKVSKNTRKSPKIPIFGPFACFSVFLEFFGYFLRLFSRPPKTPFLGLFCDFGPGGLGDFCKWRLGSQRKSPENEKNVIELLLPTSFCGTLT